MATLRKILGQAVVSALKGGDSLLNSLVAGSGATLNVEFAEEDNVEADTGLIGHIRVEMGPVRRLAYDEGETRQRKRREYSYSVIVTLQNDVGTDDVGHDYWQAVDRIFRDPRTFFRDHVTDSESNLASHAGRLEVDEDFITRTRGSVFEVECTVRITVTQKANLTD